MKKVTAKQTPKVNVNVVKAITQLVASKPGFYQRGSVVKELQKKFNKAEIHFNLDNLRKKQIKRRSGYVLVTK
jgi:hypothetical protein